MRYSDLRKIDKKVRRHFHDDITVIVLFLNHDLISKGMVLDPPLSIRSSRDHCWFMKAKAYVCWADKAAGNAMMLVAWKHHHQRHCTSWIIILRLLVWRGLNLYNVVRNYFDYYTDIVLFKCMLFFVFQSRKAFLKQY